MADGIPQFKDNPLGAIGFVLQSASAGLGGEELPADKIKKEQLAQQELELKQLGVTLKAVEQGVDLFSGADRTDPKIAQALGRFTEQFERSLPGFGDALSSGLEISDAAGRNLLSNAGDYTQFLQQMCGLDGDCIKEALSDEKTIERFDGMLDRQNEPAIFSKFQAIAEAAGGDEKLKELIADGRWSLADLNQLPEGFQFTDSEIRTISRNEDIQNGLIEFGFEPPGVARKGAESEATSEFDRQVEALVDQGVPRSIAVKVKTGVFKTATDDSGRASVVDVTTGEQVFPKPIDKPKAPKVPGEPEIVGGAEGTGGGAVLKGVVNAITDFFGAGLQFENTAEAVDQLERLRTFTTLGLAQDLAGRDTNLVRQLIIERFPEPSSLTIGDARSLSKLKAIRDELAFELEGQQQIKDNPREFTPQMVQDATAATQNLGRLVEMYNGVIDNWFVKPKKGGSKLPEGIPQGSKEIGKFEGKPVFETPDGKRLVVD